MIKYFITLALVVFFPVFSFAQIPAGYKPNGYNTALQNRPGPERVYRVYSSQVNYLAPGGEWEPINLRPEVSGNNLRIESAPYKLTLPEYADGEFMFVNDSNYDIKEERIIQAEPISKKRQFLEAAHVGYQILSNGAILYADAFPALEADLYVIPRPNAVLYQLRWNDAPLYCDDDYSNVSIMQQYSANTDVVSNSLGFTKSPLYDFKLSGGEREIILPPGKMWDSDLKKRIITFEGQAFASSYLLVKKIPCDFFDEDTVYPVYADDVDQIYNIEEDGWARQDSSSWDTAHDATVATTAVNDSNTTFLAGSSFESPTYRVIRGSVVFNIGTIVGTITEVTYNAYIVSTSLPDEDEYAYLSVVESSPASDSAFVGEDFDQVGDSIDNPTKLSEDILTTDITAAAYESWTLNAAGLSFVQAAQSGDEVVRIGLREGHDQEDVAPNVSNGFMNGITMSSSEETGTSQDPYLEITYTSGSSSSSSSGSTLSGNYLPFFQQNCLSYEQTLDGSGAVIGNTCSEYELGISGDFIDWLIYFASYSLFYFVIVFIVLIIILMVGWKIFVWLVRKIYHFRL